MAELAPTTELAGLSCPQCAESAFVPPLYQCPSCGTTPLEPRPLSGKGTIYSYTRVEVGVGRFAERVPFVIALVDLDEGPRTAVHVDNPQGDDRCDVLIGDRVAFRGRDDLDVPVFEVFERPAKST